jgi:RsiW-degrading membrane proteinase PrsW (M82 family)
MTFKNKVTKLSMITYSVICALGFAFFESIVYYIAHSDVSGAISRMFSSVPSHVCFAIIMGLLLWVSLNNKGIKRIIYLLLACIIPIIIHALYNVFLYKGIASLSIYSLMVLVILEIISVLIVIRVVKE